MTENCHPEQRDCLRPLVGRIYSLIIRFFAKEAQNDRRIVILRNANACVPLREGLFVKYQILRNRGSG